MRQADYWSGGRVGVGTPQANPTVEPEMYRLLPCDVATYAVRLTSAEPTPSARLLAYLEDLPHTLERYDTLPLDAFAFACTGSSYLAGAAAERAVVQRIQAERGYPVFTAARAIRSALEEVGARTVAILAPYPRDIVAAAERYWTEAGFDVAQLHAIDIGSGDTRAIYELHSDDALGALDALRREHPDLAVDAYVFTGTGMPTVPILAAAAERVSRPVFSSNYCLALACAQHLGRNLAVLGR